MQPQVDYSKLPQSLVDQLAGWEAKQPQQLQLKASQELVDLTRQLYDMVSSDSTTSSSEAKDLLDAMHEVADHLEEIKNKSEPEEPDFATPIIAALDKMSTAMTQAIADAKVEQKIDVAAPKVTVPKIDVSGLVTAMDGLPAAFETAINNLPAPLPQIDYTPNFDDILDMLGNINTGVRLKANGPGGGGGSSGSTTSNVNVTNFPAFPADQKVTATDATGLKTHDDYQTYVSIPDITASGVTNATLSLLVIRFVGGTGRIVPNGTGASASNGIYCPDGEPIYIALNMTSFSAYLPASTTAYAYGLARA